MNLAWFFRTLNRINPTARGRRLSAELALRCRSLPPAGVYAIGDGLRMHLRADDLIERAVYFFAYEFLPSRLALQRLRPGAVFLDIGANVGYYSLRAWKRVSPGGRVLAFEPHPRTAARLRDNIRLNPDAAIEVYELAIGDAEGQAVLLDPGAYTHGHASLRNQGWDACERLTVRINRLDRVLPANFERLDFMKIDVEGAELSVLKGAEQTIRRFKPPILLELNSKTAAVFGYDPLDVPRLLLGYHPSYRLRLVGHYDATEKTLAQLEFEGLRDGMLLLE